MQRGLEALYRVDTGLAVDDFVIGADARDMFSPQRRPREQLLVCEANGEMNLSSIRARSRTSRSTTRRAGSATTTSATSSSRSKASATSSMRAGAPRPSAR
jgi:hypothetical protein